MSDLGTMTEREVKQAINAFFAANPIDSARYRTPKSKRKSVNCMSALRTFGKAPDIVAAKAKSAKSAKSKKEAAA